MDKNDKMVECSYCHSKINYAYAETFFSRNAKTHSYEKLCKKCFPQIFPPEHEKQKELEKQIKKKKTGRPKGKVEKVLTGTPIEQKLEKTSKAIRTRSKKRGFLGECLTFADLIRIHEKQKGLCFYTGLAYLPMGLGPLSVSIDRINNSLGYIEGNVVLCCLFVNYAKNSWDLEEMKEYWKHLPKK